jgi:hypothetical protein
VLLVLVSASLASVLCFLSCEYATPARRRRAAPRAD